MTCGVYVIRNELNGRRYVGSSGDVERRWRNHLGLLRRGKHHSLILQRAWEKHGNLAFLWQIVEECRPEDLAAREQHYLDKFKAFGHRGYNCLPEARVVTYIPESVRAKMSRSNKALAASNPELCRMRSEIAKRLHAEGRLGQKAWAPGTVERVAAKNRGRAYVPNPEAIAKIANTQRERWKDPALRAAQADRARKQSLRRKEQST